MQKHRLTVKNPMLTAPACALLLALLPLAAEAHRPFLLPSTTVVEARDAWVTVDAAVGENAFEFDTSPLWLDRLSIVGPDGEALAPAQTFTGKRRSVFDVQLPKPGSYRIALVGENAMASYKLNGEAKRWRGSVEALEKEIPAGASELQVTRIHTRIETVVSSARSGGEALKPAGIGLEVLPLSAPDEYHAGETARFRVLLDGKPLPDLKVALAPGNVRYRGVLREVTAVSDAKGEFSVTWPFAEMYWISASYPPAPVVAEGQPRPAMPARRWTYAGTVEVQAQ
ncbi:MAG: DUF4198 domain-containing protein [Azonexus sp.]|nr:DUF4198 domain-containing protein [Azonexus sp.]MCK6412580.1 DUF4198 domain-containing protein [Azonexus sp.]